jgi:hypothetical protein
MIWLAQCAWPTQIRALECGAAGDTDGLPSAHHPQLRPMR